MTLHPHLDRMRSALVVRYHPSAQPQRLRIRSRVESCGLIPWPAMGVLTCRRWLERGFGGGDLFPPWTSTGSWVSGPMPNRPEARELECEWELEVAGVDPVFLGPMVSTLTLSNPDHPLLSLQIHGDAPNSGAVTTEEDVLGWMTDTATFPSSWPDVPFELGTTDEPRDASVRVALAAPHDDSTFESLEATLSVWSMVAAHYPNRDRDALGDMMAPTVEVCAPSEVTFRMKDFDFLRDPVQDVLLNGLIAYHHRVAAIASVTIGFP